MEDTGRRGGVSENSLISGGALTLASAPIARRRRSHRLPPVPTAAVSGALTAAVVVWIGQVVDDFPVSVVVGAAAVFLIAPVASVVGARSWLRLLAGLALGAAALVAMFWALIFLLVTGLYDECRGATGGLWYEELASDRAWLRRSAGLGLTPVVTVVVTMWASAKTAAARRRRPVARA